MKLTVMDYLFRSSPHPASAKRAVSLPTWLLSLIFITACNTAHADPQNLQLAAVAPTVSLRLTATPRIITQGQTVRFNASFNRDVSNYKILYKLEINDVERASWRNSNVYSYRFANTGSYQVKVNTYLEVVTGATTILQPVASSNTVGVTVEPVLKVRIIPPAMPVSKGETAVFRLRLSEDVPVRYSWQGPGNQVSNSREFRVNTSNLTPGRNYLIQLKVADNHQRTAQDRVNLSVREIIYKQPTAEIQPSILTVTQGEQAIFRATHTADERLTIRNGWRGPAGARRNTDTYKLSTEDLEPGRYNILYLVRDSKGQSAQDQAQLNVTAAGALRVEITPSQSQLLVGEQLRFEANVHDSVPRDYTYHWNGPGDRETSGKSLILTANPDLVGNHTITLLVEDGLGRRATAQASLQINAPLLTLHSESDSDIKAGGKVILFGEIRPDVQVENVRLHVGADEVGQPFNLNEPLPVSFDKPGDYRVYLTAQFADMPLESKPQIITVSKTNTLWLWAAAGGAGAFLGGISLSLRLRRRRLVSRASRLSVMVKQNYNQWEGSFDKTDDSDLGVRLVTITDLGEQSWDDAQGSSSQ